MQLYGESVTVTMSADVHHLIIVRLITDNIEWKYCKFSNFIAVVFIPLPCSSNGNIWLIQCFFLELTAVPLTNNREHCPPDQITQTVGFGKDGEIVKKL